MASATRPSLGAHEIRARFLEFFRERDHAIVKSSPLVPHNDPTLLFVNAGMVQFKDVFTGRDVRPYRRAVSVQRCVRAGGKHNDLDNVGFTPRHHTLFEMLGNFSFGDYFKQDAIRWAWELVTRDLGIPASRLVVTVYDGEGEAAPADDEAYELWSELVPRERIYRCNAKDNFWAMGDTGPCGPCSEIHIFRAGDAPPDALREGKFGPSWEDDKYMELWNLVFMQYEKHSDGSATPLPRPSIDTGAGLERLAAVVEGVESNFETTLLKPLVDRAKALAGVSGRAPGGEGPFQVIADHARAAAFLIADGVFPDRDGRSYVLRRIMRRAIRYGTRVGLDEPFFHDVCALVVERFSDAYPELREAAATIDEVVRTEEASFRRTLGRGLRRLEAALETIPRATNGTMTPFPLAVAAELYDTYGFPIDLTGVIAREQGLVLDEGAVEDEVRRRQGADEQRFAGGDTGIADLWYTLANAHAVQFVGYTQSETRGATVLGLVREGMLVDAVMGVGTEVDVVVDRTPFYGESGGQVGDCGAISTEQGASLEVFDTIKPVGGLVVHRARVVAGTLRIGERVELRVDGARRDAIRRNHSATHLLHHALREVLGPHVVQKGSLVTAERLRFDFSHGRPLTDDEKRSIEERVATMILRNATTHVDEMGMDDAKAAGAIGLFGEKYGDVVRVVRIARDSVELCGGTHVERSGDIGSLFIVAEGGIAQGVRRIEAVTGHGAVVHAQRMARIVASASSRVHAASGEELLERIEKLQHELKAKDKDIADLRRTLAVGGASGGDDVVEVAGIKLLAKALASADPKSMRDAADALRDKLRSGVVVLAGERDGKATLLAAVTKDLEGRVHAGKLVGALADHVGGRGGGRPDLAQAGGSLPSGIPAALAAAPKALAEQLGAG